MSISPADIGRRVYEIRRALGPDHRHEMPQRAFAELLNQTAARLIPRADDRTNYDSSIVTRLEKGERKANVYDIIAIAAVDPDLRGKLWLAWGEDEDSLMVRQTLGPSVARVPSTAAVDESRRAPTTRSQVAKTTKKKKKPGSA